MSAWTYIPLQEPTEPQRHKSVLMLLHGVGSHERSMAPAAIGAHPGLRIISVRAPIPFGADAYAWFPVTFTSSGPVIDAERAQSSLRQLLSFIEQYRTELGMDHVYLMGFSQGAIMAMVAALTAPEAIQGAVSLSGRFPKEFRAQIAPAERLSATAIRVSHGIQDQKLPIHFAREAKALLEEVKAPFSYQEYDAGHTLTPPMLTDAHQWISQRMKAVADRSS